MGGKRKGNFSWQDGGKGLLKWERLGLFVCLEESNRKIN